MCLYPEQQAEYDHLLLRYSEFAQEPWPPVNRGWDVEGQTLALLVPDMQLSIESYLRKRRASNAELNGMDLSADILERNLNCLPCKSRPYFERLVELTRITTMLARQDSRLD